MTFEGNPDNPQLARNMNINVNGCPLVVRNFTIHGDAESGIIEATIRVEAQLLKLAADGEIEGDPVAAKKMLEDLAAKDQQT